MESQDTIFLNARQIAELAERAAYLAQACGTDAELRQRIETMLRDATEADEFFGPEAAVVTEGPGTVIGRYKLLQKIGEGGMGVVYMAEQREPVIRKVALKIIKLGMDTRQVIARFEAERQALALMDHPNIAKVLDGGVTDSGRPYFVMDLVPGLPITQFCDEANLSTRDRLELFLEVCSAIQHAHQKGIIHRDIKPSNILVTLHGDKPVPKVIDFGVAKATQGRLTEKTLFTQFQQFIGTPAYMSPEQAGLSGLDIDTRSDIYALGVLLYELLTGRTPFDAKELLKAGLDEMRRTIQEKQPPRPSNRISTLRGEDLTTTAKQRRTDPPKLIHLVRGDLDWIVMKALEKDRARRYETANGLASDIKRHLTNEPIVARPPTTVYRFQKMVRRNKLAFAAAALMTVVLAAATGISAWQAVRATRAETVARQRLAESEAISKFLTEVFQSPDPARDGRTITVAETLGAAAKKLEADLANQPARRANLQATLGATYLALGLYREAILLQEKVRDYYLAAYGLENNNTLTAMAELATSYDGAGRYAEALKLREQVLTLSRKVNGPEHPNTIYAMDGLANAYYQAGRHAEALELRERVLTLCRKVLGPEHPVTLFAMNNLANAYYQAGRPDEALQLREQVLALRRKVLGPEHPHTLIAMSDLADSYRSVGRDKEAITLLEQACELNPTNTLASLKLATCQTWFGHDADYEATRRRLIQQAEGTDQAGTADCAAKVYCLRPSTDDALLAKALTLARQGVELGKSEYLLPWYQMCLGLAEYRNGQYAAAEQALTIAEQTVGDNHLMPVVGQHQIQGTARLLRAMSLFRQDKLEEARKVFSQAEAQMPPLPKDERKPFVDGRPASHDDLILWLAYKEAKALIEGQPAATSK